MGKGVGEAEGGDEPDESRVTGRAADVWARLALKPFNEALREALREALGGAG